MTVYIKLWIVQVSMAFQSSSTNAAMLHSLQPIQNFTRLSFPKTNLEITLPTSGGSLRREREIDKLGTI